MKKIVIDKLSEVLDNIVDKGGGEIKIIVADDGRIKIIELIN